MTGILYVVATPLGNLGDLSPRAADLLRTVPVVAAEDTRRTQGLLSSIDAHPRLISYHAHSTDRREDALLELLRGGQDVALVTDAGTPAISDPGFALAAAAHASGIVVTPIPGPTAVATALSASGLAGDRYLFLGFLPRKGPERDRLLGRVAVEPWPVVLFEAPGRLTDLLGELAAVSGGNRVAVVARELTKLHEELRRGTLEELRTYYLDRPARGEITLVVAGRPDDQESVGTDPALVRSAVREWRAAGVSRKDAVRRASDRFGIPRNEAYDLVMDDAD
jgi:16S rRNA (cytidine1402-2'-O)-methyltransferase